MHSDALLASIRPFPGCTFSPSRIAGAFASPPAPRWGGTSASGAPRCAPAPGIAMILPVVKNPGPLPEWVNSALLASPRAAQDAARSAARRVACPPRPAGIALLFSAPAVPAGTSRGAGAGPGAAREGRGRVPGGRGGSPGSPGSQGRRPRDAGDRAARAEGWHGAAVPAAAGAGARGGPGGTATGGPGRAAVRARWCYGMGWDGQGCGVVHSDVVTIL